MIEEWFCGQVLVGKCVHCEPNAGFGGLGSDDAGVKWFLPTLAERIESKESIR